ncbi:MAG TPA: gamma-glutamylcyclotransferase family protein [Gemmatimonadaceae bacterium]|jgi:hypothetical protein
MPLLFSYGTLRASAVQQKLFGRQLHGSADELPGYACVSVMVADAGFALANGARQAMVRYTGNGEDRTPGMVFDVADSELATADAYEPGEYERVLTRLASGRAAWVYTERPR